ncbi:low temperature requirement protein A [Kitasatospora azatica]|uniref:low temperature requirement protein A n=1 Tax=Kitasatospora azatica TaxID=58347 RepID=UPI000A9B5A40|nr:low temperature requirement protein A [Kitasatospora azatica]
MTPTPAATPESEEVRPLELFFDLVFVFTITQIASVLAAEPSAASLGRAAVLLTITWWMYGGYAWLTNALDLDRTGPRLLLLTGTAGFFVMSLAVPRAARPGPWGLVFGAAYLAVVVVHTVGFIGTSGHRGIARIGPVNLVSALLVLVAGLLPAHQRPWVWALACLLEWVTPFLVGVGGFSVGVGHFVERHGLAVIIVLGESITEVGAASGHLDEPGTLLGGALLALASSAAMWWLYFDREERDSAMLLERVPELRRPRVAVYSFGYAYLVMVFGIAVAAVGMQEAIVSFGEPLHGTAAGLLPLGSALFLVGLACFRRSLSGNWPTARLVAAVGVAGAGLAAAQWAGGAALLAVNGVLLLGLILWERYRTWEQDRTSLTGTPV